MIDLKQCDDVCNTDPQLLQMGDVRACIDMIDEGIAHLIDYRLNLTKKVGDIKALTQTPLGLVLRPNREADLLRRWIQHFDGKLPALAVQRLWRTLISSGCLSEQDIHLLIPGDHATQFEAIDYFGRFFPTRTYTSVEDGISLCTKEAAHILILNPESLTETTFKQLCEASDVYGLKGFLKLPFVEVSPSTPVLCFGFLPLEATGSDLSLLACYSKTGNKLPDAFFQELKEQGSKIVWQSEHQCLIERPSFLDQELAVDSESLFPITHQEIRVKILGAYPVGVSA